MEKPLPNATTIERIMWYVEQDDHIRAEALAKLADFLEECFSWEVTFNA